MTILVVDDERNIADSIAGTLIAELNTDAEVHVCYGSQQAKDFSATHYIDVIVCDIDMPKCNGISLCRSLLDRKSTRLNSSHPSRSRMPSSA